jgi:hypothetical protein
MQSDAGSSRLQLCRWLAVSWHLEWVLLGGRAGPCERKRETSESCRRQAAAAATPCMRVCCWKTKQDAAWRGAIRVRSEWRWV